MSKTFDFPAPRPWRIEGQAIWDANGACVMSALNPANMETRKLIVEAVNGKTEDDVPIPLPFDMAEARDEASRRYVLHAISTARICRRSAAHGRIDKQGLQGTDVHAWLVSALLPVARHSGIGGGKCNHISKMIP